MTKYVSVGLLILGMVAMTGCFPSTIAQPSSDGVQGQSAMVFGRAFIETATPSQTAQMLMANERYNGETHPYMIYRVDEVQGENLLVVPFATKTIKPFRNALQQTLPDTQIRYQIIDQHHGTPESGNPRDGRTLPQELESQQEEFNEWG